MKGDFHAAMMDLYERSRDLDIFVDDAIRRLEKDGGVEMARRLLRESSAKAGLMRLWQAERLDISVEALVLRERFRPLFTEEERARAAERLKMLGYDPEK